MSTSRRLLLALAAVLDVALRVAEGGVGAAQQAPQVGLNALTRERLRNRGYETGN